MILPVGSLEGRKVGVDSICEGVAGSASSDEAVEVEGSAEACACNVPMVSGELGVAPRLQARVKIIAVERRRYFWSETKRFISYYCSYS